MTSAKLAATPGRTGGAEHAHVAVATVGAAAEADGVEAALAAAGISLELRVGDAEDLAGNGAVGVDAVVVAARRVDRGVARSIRLVREIAGDVPVVVAARSLDPRSVRLAVDAGAHAVVNGDALDTGLAAAVRAACAGLLAVPRDIGAMVATPTLSAREKQILAMVVLGFTNGEIARKLYVAESTVKSHLSSAFAKLGVRSRSEAAAAILDPSLGLGTGILAISGTEENDAGGMFGS